MLKYPTMKSSDKETILLPKNQTVSIKAKQFLIKCLSGMIWVTWPKGEEQALVNGQSVSGSSKGKVCIFAFSNAVVQVEQKSAPWYRFFSNRMLPIQIRRNP